MRSSLKIIGVSRVSLELFITRRTVYRQSSAVICENSVAFLFLLRHWLLAQSTLFGARPRKYFLILTSGRKDALRSPQDLIRIEIVLMMLLEHNGNASLQKKPRLKVFHNKVRSGCLNCK